MAFRFGSAFVLIGTIVLVVFLLTFSIHQANPLALLAGAGLCIVGLWIRRRAARSQERRAERFRMLQRFTGQHPDEDL
jgi:ABC-type nickel/cobalt efflux system permease component RcnA